MFIWIGQILDSLGLRESRNLAPNIWPILCRVSFERSGTYPQNCFKFGGKVGAAVCAFVWVTRVFTPPIVTWNSEAKERHLTLEIDTNERMPDYLVVILQSPYTPKMPTETLKRTASFNSLTSRWIPSSGRSSGAPGPRWWTSSARRRRPWRRVAASARH